LILGIIAQQQWLAVATVVSGQTDCMVVKYDGIRDVDWQTAGHWQTDRRTASGMVH